MSTTTKTIPGPGPAAKTFDHAMADLKDGVAGATQIGTDAQRAGLDAMRATAKQILSFHQDNLQAAMQSGQILAGGLQDIVQHFAASARATMDEGMQALQAMTTVHSLKDAMELQTGFVRASYERATGEVNQMAETSMRVGEQAAAPLNARVTAAGSLFARS